MYTTAFIINTLSEVLVMVLMTCIQTFYYYKTIGLSPKWRGRRLALVILAVSLIMAALELVSLNIPALSWTGYIIIVITLLYPMLFMGGRRREQVLFSIVNMTVFLFSALTAGFAMNAVATVLAGIKYTTKSFFWINIEQGPAWLVVLLGVLAIAVVYALLVLVITRLNTEGKRYMPRKYWAGMMIGFAIVVVGLTVVNNLGELIRIRDTGQFFSYVAISLIAFLAFWLLLYFIFYFICRYFSKAAESNMLAIQNDMIEKYVLQKQEADEKIKILSHDLKHSLAQWRALAEEKGDQAALRSISEYEGQLSSTRMIQVENESANAIINQKAWEAGKAGVTFQADGVFHEDLLVNMLDLCSLLGNLLDNAIEAAGQAETEDLRRVMLSIRRKGNLLILIVENGYKLEPVIENGSFLTRKEDKDRHAIGMLSIRYAAEKYAGIVSNSYENNWFKATVMLCGYQETSA